MNSSDTPSRITKAFGVNGLRNAIATDSSTATDSNGVATFDKGFPEVTMQPLSAGGIPPSGRDFNGVFYSTTLQQQWYNAGMTYPFSADFATAVSGYPKGAIVPSSTLTGQWLNLNESNGTSPESSTGASTGWVPINNYGITQITLSSSSVVLSSLQASKDKIILSGALSSNVNIILPAWIKVWTIHNNCSGNYNVICKTASGGGVAVNKGYAARVYCDGVSIYKEIGSAAQYDVGESVGQIPDMSFFDRNIQGAGYQRLPGGLIIQWGSVATAGVGGSSNTGNTIQFPLSFPNTCLQVLATYDNGSQTIPAAATGPLSKSNFVLRCSASSGSYNYRWLAIGF